MRASLELSSLDPLFSRRYRRDIRLPRRSGRRRPPSRTCRRSPCRCLCPAPRRRPHLFARCSYCRIRSAGPPRQVPAPSLSFAYFLPSPKALPRFERDLLERAAAEIADSAADQAGADHRAEGAARCQADAGAGAAPITAPFWAGLRYRMLPTGSPRRARSPLLSALPPPRTPRHPHGGVMSDFCQSLSGLNTVMPAASCAVSGPEILLVDVAGVADDEGHDAGLAVLHRPGDRRRSRRSCGR